MTDPSPTFLSTADLYDEHGEALESCDAPLRQYGGRSTFSGPIATFRSHEDNAQLKAMIDEPGEGRVLVVDAGGTTRCAMIGDNMAAQAASNGWAGFVINGGVRDVAALAETPIGVKALGSNPRRSRKDGLGEVGGQLTFGGALFSPGAMLVSDDDGVVVVPILD